MPGLSGATTSRNRFQALCSHFSQRSVVVFFPRRHGFQRALLTRDAQDKEHHEPKVSDITHRSLLMTVADPHFSFMRLNASAGTDVGLHMWMAHSTSRTLDLVWICCTLPRSWTSMPLSFASFKAQSALASLFSHDFLRLTAWCSSLYL